MALLRIGSRRDSIRALLNEIPETWRPLVEFLPASGARWSEATALETVRRRLRQR